MSDDVRAITSYWSTTDDTANWFYASAAWHNSLDAIARSTLSPCSSVPARTKSHAAASNRPRRVSGSWSVKGSPVSSASKRITKD